MAQSVVLKSNKFGIILVLDPELPFRQLLRDIAEKFREADKFFRKAAVALSIEGRSLSGEELDQVLAVIAENSSVVIQCVLDSDPRIEARMQQAMNAADSVNALGYGEFYQGTLRSGQQIASDTGMIVLGDVNPGATVIANGNIVVLGSLKGNAIAGAGGNEAAFVAALDMDPVQIRIGDVIGRSADRTSSAHTKKKKKTEPASDPQIAVVKDGSIYIEPITKGLLNNLS